MTFEVPHPEIELPPGDAPLVLVAPSTAHDSGNHLVRTALKALAGRAGAGGGDDQPGRPAEPDRGPRQRRPGRLAQLQPADAGGASLVISHGGHGTVARALGAGTPVLICPIVGDMSETAMRVAWAKAGLSLPWRLCRPAPLRWAARRILGDPSFAARAGELADLGPGARRRRARRRAGRGPGSAP